MAGKWSDFAARATEAGEAEELMRQQQLEIRRGCREIMKNEALCQYLMALAVGRSFVGGRKLEDVAFAEGQRHLAISLLKLGGEMGERDEQ